ncbi:hypothetical protein M9H77_04423 [Catharanthus roseus]|uniref:Uncharacterized protein n=1 Tax=Catharanthus roseus TaxID=4058 RepID=A0ACC0CE32_CATRO|nr:hypothetical protein M9H77_04423 [Catharanthus roseus]
MEDELHHVQQLQQDVGDLKREGEAILGQSNRINLGGYSMHNNQWAYGNFSPYTRSYEHNSYDCYEGNKFEPRNGYNSKSYNRVPRNKVRNGGNYKNGSITMVERYDDSYEHYEHNYGSKNMYSEHNDSYNYRVYNCKRSSQTLGTTSRPFNYNNLKLLFCGSKKWNHFSIPMV